jgi:hypothetical protein
MCAPLQATEKYEGGRVPLMIGIGPAARNQSSRARYFLPPHFCAIVYLAAKHCAEWVGRYGNEQFMRQLGPYSA